MSGRIRRKRGKPVHPSTIEQEMDRNTWSRDVMFMVSLEEAVLTISMKKQARPKTSPEFRGQKRTRPGGHELGGVLGRGRVDRLLFYLPSAKTLCTECSLKDQAPTITSEDKSHLEVSALKGSVYPFEIV